MNKFISIIILLLSIFHTNSSSAGIIPINLNDFYTISDLSEVDISANGQTASFMESMWLSTLSLTNDPWLGDANIINPAVNRFLVFDYDFAEGLFNNDVFSAYLFDAELGEFFGEIDSFERDYSDAGTFAFDLSSLIGKTLGLSFVMSDFDIINMNLDSVLTISNLRLVDNYGAGPINTVPEPYSILLLAMGLFGVFTVRRKSDRK